MLTIGARLSKIQRSCAHWALSPIHLDPLPIAFHVQLLEPRGKLGERLGVEASRTLAERCAYILRLSSQGSLARVNRSKLQPLISGAAYCRIRFFLGHQRKGIG